jgi:hypothetical protein
MIISTSLMIRSKLFVQDEIVTLLDDHKIRELSCKKSL